ncbi:leucine-rich repeat-containing protein 71 isoform X2 [Gouania willdenowi]|uniref:leucine-rich repeat-containing protein 71 isoform X2 n=1 Tax=Gouania willdenowi TaxID=441366 RepID=UPI001054270B|nr:leucine-rich repeat-containing protein 71 isoform X2 [Gouania willdenowi]
MSRRKQNKDRGKIDPEMSKETGNVEVDFPALCDLLNIRDPPSIRIRSPASSTLPEEETTEENTVRENDSYSFKPCVEVELEQENSLNVKFLKIFGWRVNKRMFRVLQKMFLSMKHLRCIQFWQTGLTDEMIITLKDTLPLCTSLRAVTLEGDIFPEQKNYGLLSDISVLTHLSLRNNRIGDEDCRVIGSALSTPRSANKNLLSLNLAFNSIGDAGAAHIAQGLRLNRTLKFLSLSYNGIGDTGAAQLAAIFSELTLTHKEAVERRRLLFEIALSSMHKVDPEPSPVDQLASMTSSTSSVSKSTSNKKKTSQKDEKRAAKKEKQKSRMKASTGKKTPPSKGGVPQSEEKQPSTPEMEALEIVHPLLEPSVYPMQGKLLMPGNTTLTYLNLSGNKITEKPLPLFLESLEKKSEGSSLTCLGLERNLFPEQCESYEKIVQLMAKSTSDSPNEQTADEGKEA